MAQRLDIEPGVELVTGPMFSGKTGEVLRRARRYEIAGAKVATVAYAGDKRAGGRDGVSICSHAGQARTADVSVTALSDAVSDPAVEHASVVVVDEGQFYPDLAHAVAALVARGQRVIVAALSGTWEQKPFENVAALSAASDEVDYLTAVCTKCGKNAPFSVRLTGETAEVVVGGADKYAARCGACVRDARLVSF